MDETGEQITALFVWLISHQPAVLFSQNKPATNNQSARSIFLSEQISTSQTNRLHSDTAVINYLSDNI
jgi:hypothetical protein